MIKRNVLTIIVANYEQDIVNEIERYLNNIDFGNRIIRVIPIYELDFNFPLNDFGISYFKRAYNNVQKIVNWIEGKKIIKNYFGNYCVISDVSGIEINAFNMLPGLKEEKFLTRLFGTSDKNNISLNDIILRIIEMMASITDIKKRKAKLTTSISLYYKGKYYLKEGFVNGTIATSTVKKNANTYYDIFIPLKQTRALSFLSQKYKNKYNTHLIALKEIVKIIQKG